MPTPMQAQAREPGGGARAASQSAVVVQLTPLYHGVALERELAVGALGLGTLVHILYLAGVGLVGLRVTGRRMETLMLK